MLDQLWGWVVFLAYFLYHFLIDFARRRPIAVLFVVGGASTLIGVHETATNTKSTAIAFNMR